MKWLKAIWLVTVAMTLAMFMERLGIKMVWWNWPVCVFLSAYPGYFLGKTIGGAIR